MTPHSELRLQETKPLVSEEDRLVFFSAFTNKDPSSCSKSIPTSRKDSILLEKVEQMVKWNRWRKVKSQRKKCNKEDAHTFYANEHKDKLSC